MAVGPEGAGGSAGGSTTISVVVAVGAVAEALEVSAECSVEGSSKMAFFAGGSGRSSSLEAEVEEISEVDTVSVAIAVELVVRGPSVCLGALECLVFFR